MSADMTTQRHSEFWLYVDALKNVKEIRSTEDINYFQSHLNAICDLFCSMCINPLAIKKKPLLRQ